MSLLAIDWSGVGVKTAQFILSFSILVVLHEMGHFLPARWFKCRVEKFYLFFNPWFSLWKKKIGETEYGIGWIPFGGFVKISGMIDESMDKEQMNLPPQPYEFRSKPAWQRLIIMLGGVFVNVILAIVIFVFITWIWPSENLPVKNLTYGLHVDSLGKTIGLHDGDNVVSIGGKHIENFGTVETEIAVSDVKSLEVMRDGKLVNIAIPQGFADKLISDKKDNELLMPRVPAIIDTVTKEANFQQGKLQKGDTVIAINHLPVAYQDQFNELKKPFINTYATITVLRGKDTVDTKMLLKPYDKDHYSLRFVPFTDILKTETQTYTFAQAIPAGFERCWTTLSRYVGSLKLLVTGKRKTENSLGSVISIGKTFPSVWDWERFWTLTGIFSIVLAFMNVLPIPALDGGHALFTLYEMITGRKPSDKFMEYAQMAGMILLLGLMAYALGLDFWRLFK